MAKRRCRLFQVDAFTRQRFCGNPAIVVLDADELSDDEMQTIAAEVGGEVAFVLAAQSNDHDMQIRFFTPRREAHFVGHVTIAAQYVRAKKYGLPKGKLRQLTGAGIIEVDVVEIDGDYRVGLVQSPPSLGPVIPDHHRTQVLNALGISSTSLHKDCPLQIVVKGSPRLIVGLQNRDLLGGIKPDMAELTRLTPHVGADGYFVFAVEDDGAKSETYSRMFCPALGIPEDPVSGNAHGMLGTYLVSHGILKPQGNLVKFRGHQGQFVRRPGIVDVQVICIGKVAESVRIEGDAVIVFEAELPV